MRRGFTLIEVSIVILVLSLLMAIAVPSWARAREASRRTACLASVEQIERAKQQHCIEAGKKPGDPVVEGDLWPRFIKGPAFPTCPSGGTIEVNVLGEPARCTQHSL